MSYVNGKERGMLDYLDRVLRDEGRTTSPPISSVESASPGATSGFALPANQPSRIVAESTVLAAVRADRFPVVMRDTAVMVQPVRRQASLVMTKRDLASKLPLKPRAVITRLPIDIFRPPVSDPQRATPIVLRGGELYLIPDEANSVVHYVRGAPRLLEFSAQINLDADGKTLGGSATVIVALQPSEEPADPVLQGEGVAAVIAAGYPRRQWTFRRLALGQVTPSLDLPTGHEAEAQKVTGNAEAGTATFLVTLTPLAAQAWRQAFADGTFAVPGICRVTSLYAAQNRRAFPSSKPLTHACSLQVLAQQAPPEALRVVNAEQSVTTTLVVDADPVIENVVVEMQASSGSAKTETFGPAGGRLSVGVTSPDLAQEQVRWIATVSYAMAYWPPIRTGGLLSATHGWSTLIVPSSWRREVRFIAILLDSAGNVVADEATTDRVTGSLDFTADFLIGESGLQNSFDTQSQIIVTTVLPQPPGATAGKLKLTVFARRGGKDEMEVREIAPDENWVLARIYANGRIEIVTNRTPGAETDRQAEVGRLLDALSSPTAGSARPAIAAEVKPDRSGLEFRIRAEADRFWAVEAATRPELFLPDHATSRAGHSYYSSLGGDKLHLQAGDHLQLPESSWQQLLPAGILYYRLWTSRDAEKWVDPDITTGDALAVDSPYVTW